MVKPLTFKGEKRKKRKRDLSPKGLDGATSPRPGRDGDGDGGEDQAGEPLWITATSAQGVSGPITLVLAGSRPVSCIACDAAGTVFVSSMENVIESAPSSAEPHDVRQVWVTSRVAGTTGLALKSWTGKYLAADRAGILGASREAISVEEGFQLLPHSTMSGAMLLRSTYAGTVGLDTDNNSNSSGKEASSAPARLRADIAADSEEAKSAECAIVVRMQARFRQIVDPAERLSVGVGVGGSGSLSIGLGPRSANEPADAGTASAGQVMALASTDAHPPESSKFSRREMQRLVGRPVTDDEARLLKRARKSGELREKLLDMRVGRQHDHFA